MMETLKMENRMGNWNDDRLGELSGRVDEGFAKVDERFEKVGERFEKLLSEMKAGFAKVATKEELKEVKGDIRHQGGLSVRPPPLPSSRS
jgi:uncharacterized protein YjbJ (UPF0337 family)